MKFVVGEKIRAFCWKSSSDSPGKELTTTVTQLGSPSNEPDKIKVDWDGTYGWWIYKDTAKDKKDCEGWGKVICKNWKKFEDK